MACGLRALGGGAGLVAPPSGPTAATASCSGLGRARPLSHSETWRQRLLPAGSLSVLRPKPRRGMIIRKRGRVFWRPRQLLWSPACILTPAASGPRSLGPRTAPAPRTGCRKAVLPGSLAAARAPPAPDPGVAPRAQPGTTALPSRLRVDGGRAAGSDGPAPPDELPADPAPASLSELVTSREGSRRPRTQRGSSGGGLIVRARRTPRAARRVLPGCPQVHG